jgi:predicted glycosyltransferase involved in capsule biosynthesis
MSGGSFNYAYVRVETFVEELESKLRRSAAPSEQPGDWVPKLSPETLAQLAEIAKLGAHYAKLMRETELLFSADVDEDSFRERLAELTAGKQE